MFSAEITSVHTFFSEGVRRPSYWRKEFGFAAHLKEKRDERAERGKKGGGVQAGASEGHWTFQVQTEPLEVK